MKSYEELVTEGLDAPFEGRDFSWLDGRASQIEPSWSYDGRARQLIVGAKSLLDLCTGGGEMLASFAPLPEHRVATESWEPNIPLARNRLVPLGVQVRVPDGSYPPATVSSTLSSTITMAPWTRRSLAFFARVAPT
jgi:hypothetical protein